MAGLLFVVALACQTAACARTLKATASPDVAERRMVELWRATDIGAADLFAGPWGEEFAPDGTALYVKTEEKTHGQSPGMTVRDPDGMEWSVKQGPEGPVEVTLSRILSALGYHQPPVYYLPSFRLKRENWVEIAPGGRFRPHDKVLKSKGTWSWQENPFVGTTPYNSLLITLLVFNSSDLKNTNNELYEVNGSREGARRWYVVRDIGMALGETGRLFPKRNDVDKFTRLPFITGVKNGYVQFEYRGLHGELVHNRFTPEQVAVACRQLSRLSRLQWEAAFRAGGYKPDIAKRFIDRILQRIDQGLHIGERQTLAAR
jgi:hypothetical protein